MKSLVPVFPKYYNLINCSDVDSTCSLLLLKYVLVIILLKTSDFRAYLNSTKTELRVL